MKKLSNMRQSFEKVSFKKLSFKELRSCERGAVAPLIGICAILLVGSVAVAVDIGRGQVAQSKLQAALDSAGLAAGAMVGQNLDVEHLKPEAQKYLDANFAGTTVGATIQTFDLDLSDDQSIVTLNATASLPTTFMKIFGKNTMQVAAQTEITRETTGLEVAVVVDITGSMNEEVGGSPYDYTHKINALRAAGNDLTDILFGSHATVDDLWVGLVPFSQTVNIGPNHTDWLSDYDYYATEDKCVGPTSGTPACPAVPAPISTAAVSTRTNPVKLVNRYMYSSTPGWYFQHSWRGCILERWASGKDVTDDNADTEKWATYFVPDTGSSSLNPQGNNDNNWRSNAGNNNIMLDRDGDTGLDELSANRGCPENPITPLTNVKANVKAAFDALLYPTGNTHINVGAVWGWRMLSPKWRDKWGGDMDAHDLPLDYDEPLSQKAMILMTDGINTMGSSMTAYGWLSQGHLGTTSSSTTAGATLNTKTKAICDAMKAKGVLIYSIVFGNGSDTTSKNMMKYCASQADYYFFSPSSASLQTAFRAIGDSLSKLRVSK